MVKIILYISRYILGIIFLGAGLNGFFVIFGFEPFIETSPEAMELFEFQYLLIFEKFLEVLCGVLLVLKRYIPLALAILSPIIINIFLFHVFLDHSLLLLATLLLLTYLYMIYIYRENFRKIFEKNPSL